MKGCVQWNPFMVEMISPRMGLGPGAASSIGHYLTHWTTGLLRALVVGRAHHRVRGITHCPAVKEESML